MPQFTLDINGTEQKVEVTDGTPLLWVLREHLGLTGTKYGCGIAICGACVIHVDGSPMRACVINVEAVSDGQRLRTIEGLSATGDHPPAKSMD